MKKLAGQARKADLLYERQPSNSGRTEWREFCELAELIVERGTDTADERRIRGKGAAVCQDSMAK